MTTETEKTSDKLTFITLVGMSRAWKSYEAAYHSLIIKTEEVSWKGEYAKGLFVDIEGELGCKPFQEFCDAAREHGVDDTLCQWICRRLTQRLLCAAVNVDRYLTTETTNDCHQRSILLL